MTVTIKKHTSATYRASNGTAHFGQFKRVGREWHAEIRKTETGQNWSRDVLVRYAGIWDRKADAVEEIEYILANI
jgi:hypothetical protein